MNEQPGSANSASKALEKLLNLREILDDIECADDFESLGQAFITLDKTDLPDILDHIEYKLNILQLKEERKLPDLTKDVKMFWSLGHYDGPVSGIAYQPFKQKSHSYFEASCNIHARYPRIYLLYSLSKQEYEVELQRQEWFREYCGYYCDYDENGKRGKSKEGTAEEKRKAYDEFQAKEKTLELWKQREQCLKRRPIGYFIR